VSIINFLKLITSNLKCLQSGINIMDVNWFYLHSEYFSETYSIRFIFWWDYFFADGSGFVIVIRFWRTTFIQRLATAYIQNISVKRIRYGFSTSCYDRNYLPVSYSNIRISKTHLNPTKSINIRQIVKNPLDLSNTRQQVVINGETSDTKYIHAEVPQE
jgi:hypothetical protein